MSGISSGIGLISGIDSARLIAQLMAIEGQPVRNLEARVQALDIQRTVFIELSAKILAIQNSALRFDTLSFFRSFATSSTNESVVTAVAGETATPGSYTFLVHSLVTNHSVISRGFADPDTTQIGVGTLSLEVGHGQVNESTELNTLNAGGGVRRGAIQITDRSGASAVIDMSTAITVDDVLTAINSNADVDVRALVTGDRIVIEDLTGSEESNLIITDVDGGFTATDLGILADEETDRIEGADLIRLSGATPLSALNDGNGLDRLFDGPDLRFQTDQGDFDVSLTSVLALQTTTDLRLLNGGNGVRLGTIRITDRSGASVEVDLTGATTAQDVWDMIETALNEAEVSVSIQIVNSKFLINDSSDVADDLAGHLIVEDVDGFAAADLGIAADVDGDAISGRDIYRIATLGDVINAINYAPGNYSQVLARISDDGTGITLQANGYPNSVTVTAGADSNGHVSNAARDLGLLDATFDPNEAFESRRLIAGLNTVLLHSLNGGAGVDAGRVSLNGPTIDFAGVQTLQDVIDRINSADAAIVASVNAAGNGIVLRSEAGDENTEWVIEDLTGSLAADLGIAVGSVVDPFHGQAVEGGNAQLQYISRQTLLADLNAGRGVQLGAVSITGSDGAMHVVDLAGSSLTTVGEIIDRINDWSGSDSGISARINDTGDGIVIIDTADGTGRLTIDDVDGGQAAADLRIAGTAGDGENLIDGSFEITVEIGASDTLDDVVRKINEAGVDVTASVLNTGGSANPYSLTVTSSVAGRQGYMIIDSSGIDLGLTALTQARDAVVTVGGEGSSTPLLVTSNTNTLDELIEGVTFDLLAADDEEVTVTIIQDVDEMVDAISAFVSAYNEVQMTIDTHTSFNPDTYERGPLLGDSTVGLIRSRLHRVIVQQYAEASPVLSYLFTVGVRVGGGNRLEFDESKFKDAYAESPHAVEQLFTTEETGFGPILKETLEELTRDFDGVIALKDDLLSDQTKLLNDQIERLNLLLDAKRARLEAEFAALESSLAALQGQQGALATLAQMLSV